MTGQERMELRMAIDAARRRHVSDPWESFACRGCRIGLNDYTDGCRTCAYRKHSRKIRGTKDRVLGCVGCGTDYQHRTPGCETCREREQYRRKRERRGQHRTSQGQSRCA